MTREAQEYLERMFMEFRERFPKDAEDLQKSNNKIYKLESNIDDCSGEVLGYTMERLFQAGARDVHYTPVFMKKNRPGYLINVICDKKDVEIMESIIFTETTTIGIRKIEMERSMLKREIITVSTELGDVEVKVCEWNGQRKFYPEYESVAALCRQTKKTYLEIYQMTIQNCLQKM